ncbi:v-type ATPase 116kda subunit family protein, putative [Ichthyophthirius multifiliis]|uniref:V-type proton ATPase subunit a n=1 Tax=Ichthyophthirius multifiliis TaxID=5932 RepID=G0R115_ICHMU|nr:v-type ATPase 116kda subunit family protein, putative [Ichthyophthirius multifiliis]EGR28846.1 v-type ATPase 116kda subunit family protein, putative [Ichthyophthirius multifiliis]|eukprot:XP_004030082.1 v-type ATPase 116kda subunit family protein, putative [Ichthyophthirius multifiliis]
MSIFRSEDMKYCRLVVPSESAWETINELGKINALHQIDQEPEVSAMHRPYFNYVKRCDEVLFSLQNIQNQIIRFQGIIKKPTDIQNIINNAFKNAVQQQNRAGHTFFENLESETFQNNNLLNDQISNLDNIYEKQKYLKENHLVLLKAIELIGDSFFESSDRYLDNQNQQQFTNDQIKGGLLNKICGVINSDDQVRFSKMLFRLTRGNILMKMSDLDTEQSLKGINNKQQQLQKQQKKRTVFFIVFQGQQGGIIHSKVNRMCDAFLLVNIISLRLKISITSAYQSLIQLLERVNRFFV